MMDPSNVTIIADAIRNKLGMSHDLVFMLAIYRAKDEENNQSETKESLPEVARKRFFTWCDVICSMIERPEMVSVDEARCPVCGEPLLNLLFSSPHWTWRHLCGRGGYMTICPNCPKQVGFELTIMN